MKEAHSRSWLLNSLQGMQLQSRKFSKDALQETLSQKLSFPHPPEYGREGSNTFCFHISISSSSSLAACSSSIFSSYASFICTIYNKLSYSSHTIISVTGISGKISLRSFMKGAPSGRQTVCFAQNGSESWVVHFQRFPLPRPIY